MPDLGIHRVKRTIRLLSARVCKVPGHWGTATSSNPKRRGNANDSKSLTDYSSKTPQDLRIRRLAMRKPLATVGDRSRTVAWWRHVYVWPTIQRSGKAALSAEFKGEMLFYHGPFGRDDRKNDGVAQTTLGM